ncbi:hypothetical protein BK133_02455 [Paenibacillus sp. FSL H8-0548]|nr:hypothetical protein BK133_02455 [Paenibacillus sp. FSL H8-0548]
MFTGWRLSVLGIIVVGATAVLASSFNLIAGQKAVIMFILFVFFIGALESMELIKRRRKRK